jgi:hypothetical protein
MHYNFVAKRLRNHYPHERRAISDTDVIYDSGARRVIEDIAMEFAHRFLADNPEFDAPAFLDQCSPDPESFPFSELWRIDDNE